MEMHAALCIRHSRASGNLSGLVEEIPACAGMAAIQAASEARP